MCGQARPSRRVTASAAFSAGEAAATSAAASAAAPARLAPRAEELTASPSPSACGTSARAALRDFTTWSKRRTYSAFASASFESRASVVDFGTKHVSPAAHICRSSRAWRRPTASTRSSAAVALRADSVFAELSSTARLSSEGEGANSIWPKLRTAATTCRTAVRAPRDGKRRSSLLRVKSHSAASSSCCPVASFSSEGASKAPGFKNEYSQAGRRLSAPSISASPPSATPAAAPPLARAQSW
mmetsp:Transcript_28350/g.71361  ORF Transcript_28350/g.71361 Transcript_28350/m.71361 type:complete len:243 (+) Transcript_28350:4088-4816(+)